MQEVNYQNLDQAISDEFESIIYKTANRGTEWYKIGNGENPPLVLVDPTLTIDGERGWFYVYRMIDQTKDVTVARNYYPGIAYSDASAGLDVLCGYPPQSSTFCVLSTNPALLGKQTGGLIPSQYADLEAAAFTVDKVKYLALETQGSLILKLIGGFWHTNQDQFASSDDTFLDVTSYIPATSGKSRWIRIGVDTSGAAYVSQGIIFDSNHANPKNFIPLLQVPGVYRLSYAKLTYGMTLLEPEDLIPAPGMFSAPAESGGELTSLVVAGTESNSITQQTEGEYVLQFITETINYGDIFLGLKQAAIQTTDNTDATLFSFAPAADSMVVFEAMVYARQTAGSGGTVGNIGTWKCMSTWRNVGGTVTQVGSASIELIGRDDAAWDVVLDASGANARIVVNGDTNKTITWHTDVKIRKL